MLYIEKREKFRVNRSSNEVSKGKTSVEVIISNRKRKIDRVQYVTLERITMGCKEIYKESQWESQ